MKKNIAICGVEGMLGSMVLDYFAKNPNFNLLGTLRDPLLVKDLKKTYPSVKFKTLDALAEPRDFARILNGNRWIINCVGLIKPYIHDNVDSQVELALRINSLFPHLLEQAAKKIKAKIIQIETDCVFSGKKGPYSEEHPHDALDVYGKTKSLGETVSENVIHLRCSIIGPEKRAHHSLMDWFLKRGKNEKITGYSNHLWNGITTLHFAKISEAIIVNNIKINRVQHIVPRNSLNKAELLKIIAEIYERKDIKIKIGQASDHIDRRLKTVQPSLNKRIWQQAGYKQAPSIKEMVAELRSYQEKK